MFLNKYFKFTIVLIVYVLAFSSHAAEVDYSLSLNHASYDNINLLAVEEGPQAEKSNSVRGRIRVFEDTGSYTAQLDSTLETINYKNNVINDRNLLNLSALSVFRIQPERFEWLFSDVFSQTAISVLAADTIPNQQNINVFTTGPTYNLRLNSKNSLVFDLRYVSSTFETRTTDSDRYLLRVREEHAVNSNIKILFNFDNEIVNFKGSQVGNDSQLNTNYARNDKFLTLEYKKFNSFNIFEIGSTNIVFDGDVVKDQDLLRYSISTLYNKSRTSTIMFRANRAVEDRAVRVGNVVFDDTQVDATTSALDLYLIETVHLIYNKTLHSGRMIIDPYITKVRYNIQKNLNIQNKGLRLSNSVSLTGRSDLSLDFRFLQTDYDTIERVDDDKIFRLVYRYRARRNLNAIFGASYLERESTISDLSYEDTRYYMSLEYTSD